MLSRRLMMRSKNGSNQTYLFNRGDLCTENSGGWAQAMTTSHTTSSGDPYSVLRLTQAADSFRSSNTTNGYTFYYRCSKLLNLSSFSKAVVVYSFDYGTYVYNVSAIMSVQPNTALSYSLTVGSTKKTIGLTKSSASQTKEIDISELSSGYLSVYLMNRGNGSYAGVNLIIEQIWLE